MGYIFNMIYCRTTNINLLRIKHILDLQCTCMQFMSNKAVYFKEMCIIVETSLNFIRSHELNPLHPGHSLQDDCCLPL